MVGTARWLDGLVAVVAAVLLLSCVGGTRQTMILGLVARNDTGVPHINVYNVTAFPVGPNATVVTSEPFLPPDATSEYGANVTEPRLTPRPPHYPPTVSNVTLLPGVVYRGENSTSVTLVPLTPVLPANTTSAAARFLSPEHSVDGATPDADATPTVPDSSDATGPDVPPSEQTSKHHGLNATKEQLGHHHSGVNGTKKAAMAGHYHYEANLTAEAVGTHHHHHHAAAANETAYRHAWHHYNKTTGAAATAASAATADVRLVRHHHSNATGDWAVYHHYGNSTNSTKGLNAYHHGHANGTKAWGGYHHHNSTSTTGSTHKGVTHTASTSTSSSSGTKPTKTFPAWKDVAACPEAPKADDYKDSNGHYWGWAHDAKCAFRDANGKPVYPSGG